LLVSYIIWYKRWLGWPLWNICVINDHGYVPLVVNTFRSLPHSWLITGFVTRLTRRVPLVEQELLTVPEHLSSPPVFSGVRVTRSLVLYACFVDRCLSLCSLSFGHCVFCPSSIYGLWLPLGYLQTLLKEECSSLSRMAVRTTSSYHHYSCEFDSFQLRGVLDTLLCEKVCQ
jgi:hypothetical protein